MSKSEYVFHFHRAESEPADKPVHVQRGTLKDAAILCVRSGNVARIWDPEWTPQAYVGRVYPDGLILWEGEEGEDRAYVKLARFVKLADQMKAEAAHRREARTRRDYEHASVLEDAANRLLAIIMLPE